MGSVGQQAGVGFDLLRQTTVGLAVGAGEGRLLTATTVEKAARDIGRDEQVGSPAGTRESIVKVVLGSFIATALCGDGCGAVRGVRIGVIIVEQCAALVHPVAKDSSIVISIHRTTAAARGGAPGARSGWRGPPGGVSGSGVMLLVILVDKGFSTLTIAVELVLGSQGHQELIVIVIVPGG